MAIDPDDLDSLCELLIRADARDHEALPDGIWNWKLYVDGNVHPRGPGSTRRSELKLYGRLEEGTHRLVLREADTGKPGRLESNTLLIEIKGQPRVVVDARFENGRPSLCLAEGPPA